MTLLKYLLVPKMCTCASQLRAVGMSEKIKVSELPCIFYQNCIRISFGVYF